jgi:transglycosylase-like protein with SLT domain
MRRLLAAILFVGVAHSTEAQAPPPTVPSGVPRMALAYRRPIIRQVHYFWGPQQRSAEFFAQIHQESHFRNDQASSAGAVGIAQFRIPTATDVQRTYAYDLLELCQSVGGCPLDPAWAIRAQILWDRGFYRNRGNSTGDERWAFTLADYNGGSGWIDCEKALCAETPGCNPLLYFANVKGACGHTAVCGKHTKARSVASCKENGDYAQLILFKWRPLYVGWLGAE